MKRQILAAMALALAFSQTACGGFAPPTTAGTNAPAQPARDISAKLAELERFYADAKTFAGLFLPFVSIERANQVHAIERRIDVAFIAARAAVTLADQDDALDRIERALIELQR